MVEENEFDEKVEAGEVEDVTPKEEPRTEEVGEVLEQPTEDIVVLSKLKQFKQSQDTVPTANPRVLLDQDIHFKSGSVYRIYRFITDTWQKIFDSSDYTDLTDGGETTLHSHAASGADHNVNTVISSTDFATNSTSFIDITGMSITTTTGANKVMIIFRATAWSNSTLQTNNKLLILVDGVAVPGAGSIFGHLQVNNPTANIDYPMEVVVFTNALTATSHTFKAQIRTSAGTITLRGTGTTGKFQLTIVELE